MARVPLILAIVAVLLGASALGVSVASYAASSAQGPAIVVAHASLDSGGGLVPHTGSCHNVTGFVLHMTVGGPGTVTVVANLELYLYHSSANYAAAAVFVSNTSSTCPGVPVLSYIDNGIASGLYITDVSATGGFAVAAAGTLSFYVTGYDYSTGTDYTTCGFVNMVAVFYPST